MAVPSPNLHDLQVYGIVVTIILCFIVFGGVKMINRVAPAFLIPVLFSLFCIFVGAVLARKDHPAGEFSFFWFFLIFFNYTLLTLNPSFWLLGKIVETNTSGLLGIFVYQGFMYCKRVSNYKILLLFFSFSIFSLMPPN